MMEKDKFEKGKGSGKGKREESKKIQIQKRYPIRKNKPNRAKHIEKYMCCGVKIVVNEVPLQ